MHPSQKSEPPEKNLNYKVLYPTPKHQEHIENFIKDLAEKNQDLIMDTILDLGKNPRPNGYVRVEPPIGILLLLAHYRIRQGDFRILYDIRDDLKKVLILAVRRRNKNTYL